MTDEVELVRSFREFDRWRHEALVVLSRGETRTLRLNLSGTYAEETYTLDLGHQPLVTTDEVSVTLQRNGVGHVLPETLALTQDTTVQLGR